MKSFLNKLGITWGVVALLGMAFGAWGVGAWLGQTILALCLFGATKK